MTSIKYCGALKWVAYLFSGARKTGKFFPQPPWVRRMRRTGVHGVYALGLREAGTAQRNGFTAARTTSNDPRPPHETISLSSANNQRFARRPNGHLPYIRENQNETWGLRDTGGWHDNDEH